MYIMLLYFRVRFCITIHLYDKDIKMEGISQQLSQGHIARK